MLLQAWEIGLSGVLQDEKKWRCIYRKSDICTNAMEDGIEGKRNRNLNRKVVRSMMTDGS